MTEQQKQTEINELQRNLSTLRSELARMEHFLRYRLGESCAYCGLTHLLIDHKCQFCEKELEEEEDEDKEIQ